MSRAASIRALVLAVGLVILSAASAHSGTIVFDFEDGLQGWQLDGSAQRVQTQLLGGEWAIFGDGFIPGQPGAMSFVDGTSGISLANVESVTLDALVLTATDGPFTEPGLRLVLILARFGFPFPRVFTIEWSRTDFAQGTQQDFVAFIDNITFHTIPEPSVLVLLALAVMLLGTSGSVTRRRLSERIDRRSAFSQRSDTRVSVR